MHPVDDTWQAMIDGELPPDLAQPFREHRDGCARCQQSYSRLEAMAQERQRLFAMLAAPAQSTDVNDLIPVARARRREFAWRSLVAAASITLLVAAAVAVASPRLRLVVERAWHGLASSRPAGRAGEPPDSGQASPPMGVAVEPHGPLQISFEARQSSGELRISLAEDVRKVSIVASRSVRYDVRSATVVVSNAGTDATYDIAIPRNHPRVTVLVGGDTVFVKDGLKVLGHLAVAGQGNQYVLPFSALGATTKGAQSLRPGFTIRRR